MIVNTDVTPLAGESFLGKLVSANLNTTADQLISLATGKKRITRILCINASATPTIAAGGFYTGAAKSGTTIVSAAQVYTALTAILSLNVTLAANYTSGTTLYLSLTTAEGSALTADIYVFGEILNY